MAALGAMASADPEPNATLRAIADLVRRLERQAPIPFLFELEYDLGPPEHRRRVKLSNLPDEFQNETVPGDRMRVSVHDDSGPPGIDILPPLVVAFTTGSEDEWERLDDESETFSMGDADEAVPVANVRTWVETMKELQMDYEYKEYPGLSHGPIMAGSMADIYAYFAKHSKPATR